MIKPFFFVKIIMPGEICIRC